MCGRLRGLLDRLTNTDIGPTAADGAGHRSIDFGVRWLWLARQKRRCGHDLARLAIAALDDLVVEPSLLNLGTRRSRANRFYGRDLRGSDTFDRGDTGTGGRTVDMHGASAAKPHAAPKLRSRHSEHIP